MQQGDDLTTFRLRQRGYLTQGRELILGSIQRIKLSPFHLTAPFLPNPLAKTAADTTSNYRDMTGEVATSDFLGGKAYVCFVTLSVLTSLFLPFCLYRFRNTL